MFMSYVINNLLNNSSMLQFVSNVIIYFTQPLFVSIGVGELRI